MKKLLFVLALGAFASCGNGAGDTDDNDTTIMNDTTTIMTPAPDTAILMPDTMHMDNKDTMH